MDTVTYTAKISPQGQITIPKKLRERLRATKGVSLLYLQYAGKNTIAVDATPAHVKYYGIAAPTPSGRSASTVLQNLKTAESDKLTARQNLFIS